MHPLSAKALVSSGFQGVLLFPAYQIRCSKFPQDNGFDTMCAVGANGCKRGRESPAANLLAMSKKATGLTIGLLQRFCHLPDLFHHVFIMIRKGSHSFQSEVSEEIPVVGELRPDIHIWVSRTEEHSHLLEAFWRCWV